MEIDKYKCVICGEEKEGFGNNPEPAKPFKDGVCCDECNNKKVIPARIAEMEKKQNGKTK